MLSWLAQGVIVVVAAFVGVYFALWLFARRQSVAASREITAEDEALAEDDLDGMTTIDAPAPEAAPEPPEVNPVATTASAIPPHLPPDVRRQCEVDEDRLTIVVEMPAAYLGDAAILDNIWAETVNWVRDGRAVSKAVEEPASAPEVAAAGSARNGGDWQDADHLEAQLDDVLRRLQSATTRRQQLHALPNDGLNGVQTSGA